MLARDVPATEQLLSAIATGDDQLTEALVEEVTAKGGGVQQPATSEAVEGRWRLVWSAQVLSLSPTELHWHDSTLQQPLQAFSPSSCSALGRSSISERQGKVHLGGCRRLVGEAIGLRHGMPSQSEDANPLQKRLAGVVENYQVIGSDELEPGRLENVVNLLPGITVRVHVHTDLHTQHHHTNI